ncbi:rab6-family small gtpase, putative [Ichthyophthirius multifiliis]|uniref:Rab6-family small gtpase, putative n=1 Tax=Ichthyophthirius multifiliis TaxID=5932 RepID=G0R2Z6_ICHMU|nr:rab6-family small gtpase, putative [Ichthyophthirius multifiliis]EGR28156.1 rab6-family small gtpase, putative [Ichthyophthirius multifiliis]|eukprot:XP_004027501.1 rab6-family small gtpase, putative [Ichthyophthirius multifiliis]
MQQSVSTGPVVKYKIVFLGDQSVGKTSIINRFIYDNFTGSEQPTVGIDFICKTISLENKTLRLQLWDTAGQERFKSLIPSYIRDSNAAIIVYEVIRVFIYYFYYFQLFFYLKKQKDQSSFNNLSKWIEEVKEERGNDALIFVLGNKSDLEDRKVSTTEATQVLKQFGLNVQEVSAKSGQNIGTFFKQLSYALSGGQNNENDNKNQYQQQNQGQQQQQQQYGTQLKNPDQTQKKDDKKSGCC